MEKLKPCPFCGGKGIYKRDNWDCFIRCEECNANTNKIHIDFEYSAKDRAIKAWNKRAEEVRHGEWIYEGKPIHCNICGYMPRVVLFKIGNYNDANFCPNCGAKMYGKEIEDGEIH